MFAKLHDRLGTAGLVVAIVALVAALGGTAYAAAKLNGTQKKEVEKIAKKFAGKPGAPGATGAAGPKGDPGAAGAPGKDGSQGPTGSTGPTGKEGKEGKEGSPWTAGGTLPSGKTETGAWVVQGSGFGNFYATVSFPIALGSGLDASHVHMINNAGEEITFNGETGEEELAAQTKCLGTAEAPAPVAGNLCVYASFKGANMRVGSNLIILPGLTGINGAAGAGTTGARIVVANLSGTSQSAGTWAVAAP